MLLKKYSNPNTALGCMNKYRNYLHTLTAI